MAHISDLKGGVDTQFRSALDLLAIARDLNAIRRELQENDQESAAAKLEVAIGRVADISEAMIDAAKASGRSLAEITRSTW